MVGFILNIKTTGTGSQLIEFTAREQVCCRRGRQTSPTLVFRRKLHHHRNQWWRIMCTKHYYNYFHPCTIYSIPILQTHSLSLCLALVGTVPASTVVHRLLSNLALDSFGIMCNNEAMLSIIFSNSK